MIDIIVAIIATIAAVFILLAAIGIIKMPDTFLRISATTKASTFGVGLSMLCAAIYFQDMAITFKIIAVVSFLLLTAPVGAHLLCRTCKIIGIPQWDKYVINDMKGRYDMETHELRSSYEELESEFESEFESELEFGNDRNKIPKGRI